MVESPPRAVVVMGKVPRPGHVKTRLTPPFDPEVACRLYRAFLADVFAIVERARQDCMFECVFACALADPGDDALARDLAPPGWHVVAQSGTDLGERMTNAFLASAAREVVLIGSDSPTMPSMRIAEAFAALERGTPVVGPTDDGGYYLIGLAGEHLGILREIPWSSPAVMSATRAAARRIGVPLTELERGFDIDDVDDLRRVARDPHIAASEHTARALAELGLANS